MATPDICSVPECGRKALAGRLCQTHRKQLRKHGAVRPIRRHRSPRRGTIKHSGVTLSADCAGMIERYAAANGLTVHAAMTDIIEEWATHSR